MTTQTFFQGSRNDTSVASDLRSQPRGHAVVSSDAGESVVCGHLRRLLATLLQQAAIGGMRDGFGHHGGVDDDAIDTCLADESVAPCGLDGDNQQCLHAFFANAFPPARQAARIERRFGLQKQRGINFPILDLIGR